jgi:hypothetical protein
LLRPALTMCLLYDRSLVCQCRPRTANSWVVPRFLQGPPLLVTDGSDGWQPKDMHVMGFYLQDIVPAPPAPALSQPWLSWKAASRPLFPASAPLRADGTPYPTPGLTMIPGE